jgi:IPT/TIG domain
MDERSEQGSADTATRVPAGTGRHRRGKRGLTGAVLLVLVLALPVVIKASTAAGQSGLVRIGASPALPQGAVDPGCSATSKADQMFLYPPGQPQVESLAPHSGSAAGGTTVAVHGQNLGCPLSVAFADNEAESFSPVQALLACGSTTAVTAVSPP